MASRLWVGCLLFSLSGIGAVVGALMATRMARWIGQARSLLVFTFVAALAGLLGPLWLLFSPLRKMRDLPSGDEAAHLAGRPLASESETSSHR
ncbi:hypothetical protein ACQP1V_32195 [Microtetraspora malaysiensis]|uniref:hypothetical protein n=1 Tax=Microtetraspora malaysiensis TaxID=161358 RepID=UPI003D930D09